MFLFTTPTARESAPATPVVDAIRQGAERTGTGFDYLLATARRESALDPAAQARSSSASGLFQFIEQTWLGLVKSDGARHGLGEYAEAVATRSDGTLAVSDPVARQQILDLRHDPQVASVMAGTFTQRNRELLASELGREPSDGDLYIAHFLGARGAVDLIRAAQRSPNRAAAADFPDAAASNRNIFYDRRGRARGAGEVYALLAANHAPASPVAAATADAPNRPAITVTGPTIQGLFRAEGRRGPMSEEVARLWRSNNAADARVKTASREAYFPRLHTQSAPETAVAEPFEAMIPQPADVPLPPPRPASLGPGAETMRAVPGAIGRPLDLGAFMTRRKA